MKGLQYYIVLMLKGIGMGAANVIPGVSGGTVALITGIFEELIDSIKSFNLEAVKLILKGKFKEFAEHINLWFLISVFFGVGISILSLAKVLGFLFMNYPIYIWAYFFGLVLGSIYFVGKTVEKWSVSVIVPFVLGTAIALIISFLKPATENQAFIYLVICGAIAVCSMILPGLSGSFVLILLGNYQLVFIDAINDKQIGILAPVVIGAAIGLIAFSNLLSWIFKKYRDQTISTLTGFILGSLLILWPWKNSYDSTGDLLKINDYGAFVSENGDVIQEEVKVFKYNQIFPEEVNSIVIISFLLLVSGVVSIWLMEKYAGQQNKN